LQTEQLTTISIEVIESENLLSDKQINVNLYTAFPAVKLNASAYV